MPGDFEQALPIEGSFISPISKDEIEVTVLADGFRNNGRSLSSVLGDEKFRRNTFGETTDPTTAESNYRDFLRGYAGEAVSRLCPPLSLETIYMPPEGSAGKLDLGSFQIVSPFELVGASAKERLLMAALQQGPPPRGYSGEEFVLGYASREGGIAFDTTVMPDGIVVSVGGDGRKVCGVVEVKSYFPYEGRALVNAIEENIAAGGQAKFRLAVGKDDLIEANGGRGVVCPPEGITLGVDLEGEIAMADFLRGNLSDEQPLGLGNVIVFRFPSDAPTEALQKLGELANKEGYSLIIQRLPFSSGELNGLGVKVLRKGLDLLRRGGRGSRWQLSKKDMRVVENVLRKDQEIMADKKT